MLKKIVLLWISLSLWSGFIWADRLEDVKKSGILKVGVKHDFEPFGYIEKNGEVVGFDLDLVRYIAKEIGVKVEFQKVTSKNRIELVANGTVDIAAASMTHKVSRDADIDFTISYFFDGQGLLTRQNSRQRNATAFNGKDVAAITGATSGENLKRLVPKVRITYFDSYDLALMALSKGEIDAITTDSVWCAVQAKKSNGEFKVLDELISFEPYGMGVPENESNFKDAINFAIQKAVSDGTYAKLYEKWFGKYPDRLPEVWPN
jgi:polar amino acid transport system substrate-binding protein